jgi:GTPase Era involved in 16S rRNA processing
MGKMSQSINAFCDHLEMIERALESIKSEGLQGEDRIFASLEPAVQKLRQAGGNIVASSAVRKLMEDAIAKEQAQYDTWLAESRKRSAVKERLDESAMGLIVAVFGRTNAGKSTLGNFIRGKTLREAPFSTRYNNPHGGEAPVCFSPIRVVEQIDGNSEDVGQEWFKTGSTETTHEAQIFSGHGLTWLDTPGFGSLRDDEMGGLAKKYVEQSDLIIYLDHSESPGLRDHAKRLKPFLTRQRKVCLVLTQSDKHRNVRDADGKPICDAAGRPVKKLIGKDPEDRKAQEEQELKALADVGVDLNDCDAKAISISVFLVQEAVHKNDEDMYEHSNMNEFFSQFKRVMPDEDAVRRLKKAGPIAAVIELIDIILAEDKDMHGLSELIYERDEKIRELREKSDAINIEDEADMIVRNTMSDVMNLIRAQVEQEAKETETGNSAHSQAMGGFMGFWGSRAADRQPEQDSKSINTRVIDSAVKESLKKRTNERAGRILKEFFRHSDAESAGSLGSLGSVSLSRVTETHTYEVTETEYVEREPKGLLEKGKALFFGETYLKAKRVTVQRTNTVDLGYNTDEIISQITESIRSLSLAYAKRELEEIKTNCLEKVIRVFEDSRSALVLARKDLEAFRKELAESGC